MAGAHRSRLDDLELTIYGEAEPPASNSNVDVEVAETDGTRWSATFFTLENVEALFLKNAVTGECARGTYLWASNMILVELISTKTIEATIRDLRASGAFAEAFQRLRD